MQDIQVMLKSDAHHASVRSLKVPEDLNITDVTLVTVHVRICCCFLLAVRSSVPSGEGAWHHHLSYGCEGESH